MYKYTLFFFVIISQMTISQEYQWDLVTADNSELPNQTIKSIAVDSAGTVWYGTYMGGVASEKDGIWTTYNNSNSELPHNYVNSITIDKNNVKWIGTDGGGLARFDGEAWEIYKTSNSDIPSNVVMSTYCDDDGSIWIGTYFGGLAHYSNGTWNVYNDENSSLLSNKVVYITKDKKGLLWIGTQGGGLASFDGKNWNVYTEQNSKLPNDYIYSIAVDEENNKWIGTGGGGVVMFNDIYFVTHATSNSLLTDDNIRPIAIDPEGNKWIGTYIGGINKFDGSEWTSYDFQNSAVPDDEITCMTIHDNAFFIGTERSGVIRMENLEPAVAPPADIPVPIAVALADGEGITEEIATRQTDSLQATGAAIAGSETATVLRPENKIVLVMDASDVYFDKKKLNLTLRSFKYLLNKRERIDNTYEVKVLIYSSNYDVKPNSIVLNEKQMKSLHCKDVIYLEGESAFTDGIKKAFNLIKLDYTQTGNNQVMAATHKFIKDDEVATVVVKDNLDNHYITFSLLVFKTKSWKLENKMRNIVPKGHGHYYSITPAGIKDNWSITGQVGTSVFRGDMDVQKNIRFPGVFGFAVNKQVLSTGVLNGGVKAQFNFGKLQGEKNGQSFTNNYMEGCLNFQVIMNKWINQSFRFERFRPYAFAGIGFINYRALLKNENGEVINGYGYSLDQTTFDLNSNPDKTKPETDLMFPVGLGVNYKLNDNFNIEMEASSRFINSDKLDAKVNVKNDKYWFFSIGVTYKINNKQFLSDVLNK